MAIEPTLEPARDTTQLDRSEESATTSLYSAAIGPIGRRFYLPLFARFEAANRAGISWNWAASLNTLNWLAFRGLWSAALGYAGAAVGLALLIFGIGRLVFQFSETTEMALLAAFAATMFVVPGLFGNALLHADCRKRMANALSANTTLPEACAMLGRQASSRNRMVVIAVANLLLAGLLAGAYLKLPSAGNLPMDTLTALSKADPLGAKTSASAVTGPVTAASAPPASQPVADAASAPMAPAASAPVAPPASAPSSAPSSTPASVPPATPATIPASSATAASAPASKPVTVASAPAPTPKPAASTPRSTASAPARAASQAAVVPKASSPQVVGKVYRSEPTPPVAKPAADKPSAVVVTPPAAVKPVTATKAAAPVSAPAAKPTAASKGTNSAPKTGDLFLVNVGLFAQEANANNAMAKLKAANLPAYSDDLKGSKGKLTRVRVGPFSSQADADAAAVKIKALGLDAMAARQ